MCELTEAVLLVASELTTNAVAATSGARWEAGLPPVRLWVLGGAGARGAGEVMLLVWDAVAEVPAGPAGELAESGRGLWIVQSYCASWDFYLPPPPTGGKVARALIDRPCPRTTTQAHWLRRPDARYLATSHGNRDRIIAGDPTAPRLRHRGDRPAPR
jgi:hypothetical protein